MSGDLQVQQPNLDEKFKNFIDAAMGHRTIIGESSQHDFSQLKNIVLCADKNVIRSLGVLMCSILQHNTGNCLAFHIFFDGKMDPENIHKLMEVGRRFQCVIVLYELATMLFTNFSTRKNITATAYYRLIVPYILDNYHVAKCLYLDTDTLVLKNLSPLFQHDEGIAYVVRNSTSIPDWWRQYCQELGMKTNKYFNSGVLLLQIPEYIRHDIGHKALRLLEKNAYQYMDQDVLNILLEGHAVFAQTVTYNCTMSATNDIYPGDDKVAIVHFTGDKKPWKLYTYYWGEPWYRNDQKRYSWKYVYYKKWRECALVSPWAAVPFESPHNSHEWRYLSKMYFKGGDYGSCLRSYIQYIKAKI